MRIRFLASVAASGVLSIASPVLDGCVRSPCEPDAEISIPVQRFSHSACVLELLGNSGRTASYSFHESSIVNADASATPVKCVAARCCDVLGGPDPSDCSLDGETLRIGFVRDAASSLSTFLKGPAAHALLTCDAVKVYEGEVSVACTPLL
jgi:hypothetical protein